MQHQLQQYNNLNDLFKRLYCKMREKRSTIKILVIPFLLSLLFPSVLLAQTDTNKDTITGVTESGGFTYNNFISGDFRTQYEGRWAGRQDDHDMYQYLRFQTKDFYDNKLSIAGSGRLSEDLDGHEPKSGAFRDILDTYDSSVNGRLYYLYGDIKNPLIDNSTLRVGRQYIYSVDTILFDGVKYDQQIGPIETYAFGGLRASQYSSTYFDTVTGAGVAARPFIDTRTNVDYMRIIDDSFIDDEIGLNVWQKIHEDFNFYGRFDLLNSSPKDLMVKFSWDKIDWDANVDLSYFQFLHSIAEQSNNISPYYQVLGTFRPFYLISLTGYKGLGEHYGISSGVDYRRLINEDQENTFNRDYSREFFSFMVNNVLLHESQATFTVEHWDVAGYDNSLDLGVDLGKKIDKFDVGIGTSYSFYKYNFTGSNDLEAILDDPAASNVEQRVDVRTYYMRIKYLLTKKSDITFRWTTEISDPDPGIFHQLLLSYSTNF